MMINLNEAMAEFFKVVDKITPSSVYKDGKWERRIPAGTDVPVDNQTGTSVEIRSGSAMISYLNNGISLHAGESVFVPKGADFHIITNGTPASVALMF